MDPFIQKNDKFPAILTYINRDFKKDFNYATETNEKKGTGIKKKVNIKMPGAAENDQPKISTFFVKK